MTDMKPRAFNDVSCTTALEVLRKSSDDAASLSGEIFFYNHIPLSIKDCFPIMLDYDTEGCAWYDVEKVFGTTASHLLTSQDLSVDGLFSIMGTLHRVHTATDTCNAGDDATNMYGNYAAKLTNRWKDKPEAYANLQHAETAYNELLIALQEYVTICCNAFGNANPRMLQHSATTILNSFAEACCFLSYHCIMDKARVTAVKPFFVSCRKYD